MKRRLPDRHRMDRAVTLAALAVALAFASTRIGAQTGCPNNPTPFTDLSNMPSVFCQAVAAVYFTGITSGTTATTYSPANNVTRDQMAAFLSRTHDSALRRGSRRAALGQWWTSRTPAAHRMTDVGDAPQFLASDGEHVYVSNTLSANVTKVQASTGQVIETAPNVVDAQGTLVAAGYLWTVGFSSLSQSYIIRRLSLNDLTDNLGVGIAGTAPLGLTCDGANIWTANFGTGPNTGSISRLNISQPSPTTTFTAGFNRPFGIVFDGAWLWVTDQGDHSLKRVNPATGAVEGLPIPVGNTPAHPTFDGTNLWVPSSGEGNVKVVRAVGGLQGTVLATLTTGAGPIQAAFDGERVLVTNFLGHSVSLYKAADLTLIGTFAMPGISGPTGVCSDGVKFWVTLQLIDQIVSF